MHLESRLRFAPAEFRQDGRGAGLAARADARPVDDDRILVGLILDGGRDRRVELMAAFLAVLPDLLDGHSLLVDLVDDGTAVLLVLVLGLHEGAAVAVVKDGDVDNVALAQLIDLPGGVLRPGPVEAALALADAAREGPAVLADGREDLVLQTVAPAVRGGEDPLHLLVTADLDDGGLVAGGEDDRVVDGVVVD